MSTQFASPAMSSNMVMSRFPGRYSLAAQQALAAQQGQAQDGSQAGGANPTPPPAQPDQSAYDSGIPETDYLSAVQPQAGIPQQSTYNDYTGGFTNAANPANMFQQNRMAAEGQGNALQEETLNQANYYGQQMGRYQQAADMAYGDLAQTPGYTPQEASQINVNYGQYMTPQSAYNQEFLSADQQAAIAGDPYASMAYLDPTTNTDITQQSTQQQQQQLQQLQQGLNSSINPDQLAVSSGYTGAVGGALTGEQGALGTEQSGLNKAAGAEQASLLASASNPGLAINQQFAGSGLTDAQVQEMKTAAGTRAGDQFRSTQDQIEQAAIAQGNTSPAALAAALNRSNASSAVASGNAEVSADIAARQAQFNQAQTIEQMRQSDVAQQSGMQMNAAQTGGAAQMTAAEVGGSAAQQVGQQDIAAQQAMEAAREGGQQFITQEEMNAANIGGQAGINTAYQTGQQALGTAQWNQAQQAQMATAAENASSQRNAMLATNQQQVQQQQDQTKYNQGVGSAQLTSQGAQTVGNARQAGQQQYRNYLSGQAGQAQQGQQTATGQQVSAYGATTGAVNTASGQAGQYALGKAGQPSTFDKVVGAVTGGIAGFATGGGGSGGAGGMMNGGYVDTPTLAVLGENGPEYVQSLGGFDEPSDSPESKPQQPNSAPNFGADMSNMNQMWSAGTPGPSPSGAQSQPWWKRAMGRYQAAQQANNYGAGAASAGGSSKVGGFNPVSTYQNVGQMAGMALSYIPGLAKGAVISKPTLAVVGDKGPEVVVPLNPGPKAKLTPGTTGMTLGAPGNYPGLTPRARYRRPTGPAAEHGPIKMDWPLIPSHLRR